MEHSKAQGTFFDKHGTALALILAAVILGGAYVYGRGTGPAPAGEAPSAAVDIKNVNVSDSPSIGDADAPVVIAVWFDFQCSFCKRYDADTISQVKTEYVDTGKVRVVFKDFQFFPGSNEVAVFGRALWEAYPEKHHEWFTAVMALPIGEGSGLTIARVQEVARNIPGVDVNRVTGIAKDRETELSAAVAADQTEGRRFGIKGTPGTIIGTEYVNGAQPFATLQGLIEAELAK